MISESDSGLLLSRHMLDLYGLTYFKPSEFNHYELMNPVLLRLLDLARATLGKPIYITSSFRTAADNIACGGSKFSTHLTGDAVDIRCNDAEYRFELLKALIDVGFRRIGIYPNHIHVDVGYFHQDVSSPVIWYGTYNSKP